MRTKAGKHLFVFMVALCLMAIGIASPADAGWKGWLKKATQKAKNKSGHRRKVSHENVSAVRGLGEEVDAGDEAADRDFEGLEWLESIEITEQDLDTFVREGRLAP